MIYQECPMLPHSADIAVVGGGIAGGFIAYRLAQEGLCVALLEKNYVGWGATGRNGGGVRQNRRHPAELALARESLGIWDHLSDELDLDLEFKRQGNLWLIENEADMPSFMDCLSRQNSAGVTSCLLGPEEVRELLPPLASPVLGGLWVPGDGQASPLRLGVALERALLKVGVQVCRGVSVHSVLVSHGMVEGVATDKGNLWAPVVVNAAGAWSRRLAETCGITLPIQVVRDQIFVTEPVEPISSPSSFPALSISAKPSPATSISASMTWTKSLLICQQPDRRLS
jgi:sarcosine oxidase subunit beta